MKINQRLFDHYSIDTSKDLGIRKRCPRPFDTVLIDKKGSCYACECQSWLPQSIGNLQVMDLQQIIEQSKARKALQESIEKGTYQYCNNQQCSWLVGKDFRYFEDGVPDNKITQLRLAIDDSCNLRCPSCRTQMIFHKQGAKFQLGIRLADRINNWLLEQKHDVKVHIGSDGDPFASHVYRHFMEQTPRRDNIKYSILTNGLMFKEFHREVPHIIGRLQDLGVSMDGATRNTYERLRLGGRWDKIIEGLECMAEQRQRHGFGFILHFVIQKDNYHEMMDMVDLAERYNADKVWLNRIQDWGTMQDFDRQVIWDLPDYKTQLAKVIERIQARGDRFIECPTLVSEEVHYRNRN